MNFHTDDKLKSNAGADNANKVSGARAQNEKPSARKKPRREHRLITVLRWIFKLLLPLAVIFGMGFGASKLISSKPEVNRRPPREKAYAVQVKPAVPAQHQPDIILYGTVSAARKVDLRALVAGEVIWVNPDLDEGRTVEFGEAMVRIDPFDYQGAVREAKANLTEAKAKMSETHASIASDQAMLKRLMEQRDFGRSDLQRAEKLLKSGSLTKQALEVRKLALSQREQAVETRQNNLAVLNARIEQQNANIERLNWRLEQAERNLADTTLKAPFNGLVQAKSVDVGRSVSGNDTLVSIYDPNQMDVRFTLSDSQYGRLNPGSDELLGREIRVNWKLGDVVQGHKATIERITPEVSAADGGIKVYARIEDNSNLRAGTFVELVVPDKAYENAISVPQAALYAGDLLYVNKDGRMEPKKVSILAYLGETALVDGSAFSADELIVTTRVAEAGPGLKLVVPGSPEATTAKGARSGTRGKRPEAKGKGKAGGKEQDRGENSPQKSGADQ